MSIKKTNKRHVQSYEEYISKELDLQLGSSRISEELAKAEPDLIATPEPYVSEELKAAIEVIHDGALQDLSPTQQQIFQMSVVEGLRDFEVMEMLSLDEEAFHFHMKRIGTTLRRKCEKKLQQM